MNCYYKAKISLNNDEIVFEMNNDLLYEDAVIYAQESVKKWLETYAETGKNRKIFIKYRDVTRDLSDFLQ